MSNINKQAQAIISDIRLKHGSDDFYAPIIRWDEFKVITGALEAAEKRIAELERGSKVIKCWSCQKSVTVDQVKAEDGYCPFCDCGIDLEEYETAELVAAGIITRIEG